MLQTSLPGLNISKTIAAEYSRFLRVIYIIGISKVRYCYKTAAHPVYTKINNIV